ncbi:hypothetical protein [Paraglaciecola aestuariivivens]
MRRFTEHGSISCHIQDSILFIEGDGPWNLEALEHANYTYQKLMGSLHGSIWGKVVVLKGDPIYVPDAASYLVEAIKQDRKQGCIAAAIIVSESNSPEFAKRHLSDIHTRAKDSFRFFADKQEATWWLVQKLSSAQLAKN